MAKKQVTIYDIAKALDLSPSTISRGLNNDSRINANTRKRIAETARRLNYFPNRVAAGLRGGATGTIGVIVPRIDRQFFASAISGIEEIARQRKYQVVITQSNEDVEVERKVIDALAAARVDGIIASVSMQTEETKHFQKLQQRNFPLVFFDRVGRDANANRVVVDDRESSMRAVRHLAETGARRIAHFGGPEHVSIYSERHRGYVEGMKAVGLAVNPDYVYRNHLTEDRGYEACEELLAMPEPPDAIFAASDYGALGAITYCREHGINVPERLKIVGFANERFTKVTYPALSTIEQFSSKIGRSAAELLFTQIDADDTLLAPREITITGELIIRESSEGQ